MAIYAMPDHIHILMAISMNMEPRKIMQVLKAESTKWVNEQGFLDKKFEWQRGYGWFHVSASGVNNVVNYISRQPEHHQRKKFLKEYEQMLIKNGIAYDPRYVFTEPT